MHPCRGKRGQRGAAWRNSTVASISLFWRNKVRIFFVVDKKMTCYDIAIMFAVGLGASKSDIQDHDATLSYDARNVREHTSFAIDAYLTKLDCLVY